MKVEFDLATSSGLVGPCVSLSPAFVSCETDRLTDVVLCPPHHLAPVPCCAVARTSLENGFSTRTAAALEQHAALVDLLREHGVRCHMLQPSPDLPDMCFTRDVGVATPFGLVALAPAMPHRQDEVAALTQACARWNVPVAQITRGTLEGGDICVARDGLLLIGMSGERSSAVGVEEFAAPFRKAGWEVVICPFHADHLHLDTIFCMLAEDQAIGCLELLDPAFVRAVGRHGISILPAPASAAARLGCNILSLGERCIIASDADVAVTEMLRKASYQVEVLDVSEFAACGGGIHCLTQPLRRSWS
jgi:arginine deiminase